VLFELRSSGEVVTRAAEADLGACLALLADLVGHGRTIVASRRRRWEVLDEVGRRSDGSSAVKRACRHLGRNLDDQR
jgi:hypothetical protein